MLIVGFYSVWLYRYTINKVRGTVTADIILSLLASCIAAFLGGIAVAQLGAPRTVVLLAAIASAATVSWTGLRWAVVSSPSTSHSLGYSNIRSNSTQCLSDSAYIHYEKKY